MCLNIGVYDVCRIVHQYIASESNAVEYILNLDKIQLYPTLLNQRSIRNASAMMCCISDTRQLLA